jgi:hypothetical protein
VKAVLQDKQFLSTSVSLRHVKHPSEETTADHSSRMNFVAPPLPNSETIGHHEAVFYSNDAQLLDNMSEFIGAALSTGNAAVVVATGSHRDDLVHRLQAYGLDVDAALEEGRYIALDAADTISTCLVNGVLDSGRFLEAFGNLISTASHAAKGEHRRVVVFGEGADLLWKRGNAEAAIQDEKLCNQLIKQCGLHFLCGYAVAGNIKGLMDDEVVQRICHEHSSVYCPT